MIYEIDQSNKELALKEIHVCAGTTKQVINQYYRAKATSAELGMTRAKYKKIETWPAGSFRIISHVKLSAKELTKKYWKDSSKKLDLSSPDNEIHVFSNGIYLKAWSRENLEKRRTHLLKRNHPTSTHPKISRAMINIANTKHVFDPFCGAGGILLEAKLMNKKITGIDIDKKQIERAKLNIGDADLRIGDSLEIPWPDTIVTDLPYGRNSKIQKDFYKKFFDKVRHGVIGLPAEQEHPETKFCTTIYLHKSLSKKIILI